MSKSESSKQLLWAATPRTIPFLLHPLFWGVQTLLVSSPKSWTPRALAPSGDESEAGLAPGWCCDHCCCWGCLRADLDILWTEHLGQFGYCDIF